MSARIAAASAADELLRARIEHHIKPLLGSAGSIRSRGPM